MTNPEALLHPNRYPTVGSFFMFWFVIINYHCYNSAKVINKKMAILINFINIFFNLLIVALFIRIILSWFRISEENILIKVLNEVTDPILLPFQKIIPPVGMIDFSPIAAFIALEVVKELILFIIGLI